MRYEHRHDYFFLHAYLTTFRLAVLLLGSGVLISVLVGCSTTGNDHPTNNTHAPNTSTGRPTGVTTQPLQPERPVAAPTMPASGSGPDAVPVVSNPNDVTVLVNKHRALPAGYSAPDLREPTIPFSFPEKSEKRLMRAEAATAVEKLFARAEKEGIKLNGISAYRSYERQKSVYSDNVKNQGEVKASQVSAKPGTSEHQTGLAIDVSSPSVKNALSEAFGQSKEGKWLAAHVAEYGFIIRYPKGKDAITGYTYEPWHIRYVGVDVAKEIMTQGITLEEYFRDTVPVAKPTAQ